MPTVCPWLQAGKGVGDGVAVGDTDGETLGDTLGVGVGDIGVLVGETVGLGSGVAVGKTEPVGVGVGGVPVITASSGFIPLLLLLQVFDTSGALKLGIDSPPPTMATVPVGEI